MLCKHLVQAVHSPAPDFFREVIRRRVTPFYSHRLLQPKNGSELNVIDSGSVSDGDGVELELSLTTETTASSGTRGTKRKRAPAAVPNPLPSSPCTPVADEEEDDLAIEFMKKRIIEVEEGLKIMQSQLDRRQDSKLWLRSMKANNIGGDLANMATDVRRFTTTGTVRTTTYAKKGDKPSARYTRNTMGLRHREGSLIIVGDDADGADVNGHDTDEE
ncbi:hypothetical protein B0H13DRAFT_2305092 [Mycena leptocephala]|nr:hypothetical protein B0H13DRAFT_2305092 [Mycena leptocephala]